MRPPAIPHLAPDLEARLKAFGLACDSKQRRKIHAYIDTYGEDEFLNLCSWFMGDGRLAARHLMLAIDGGVRVPEEADNG